MICLSANAVNSYKRKRGIFHIIFYTIIFINWKRPNGKQILFQLSPEIKQLFVGYRNPIEKATVFGTMYQSGHSLQGKKPNGIIGEKMYR